MNNNSNKKILILAIFTLLILIGGGYYSYNIFYRKIPVVEIKDSPFSIVDKNQIANFKESTDWYDTDIAYPKDNKSVTDIIINKWNDFAKETGVKNYTNLADAKKGLEINVDGLKYAFSANYTIATSSKTFTYIYEIYTFTGGAHGGTETLPISLDENLNIIPVEQILPTSKLQKVSVLAKADIIKQKRERMQSEGGMTSKEIDQAIKTDTFIDEGIKPTRDNYSTVWFEGDNLVISFGQYQVGAYVEGDFLVKIPVSSL